MITSAIKQHKAAMETSFRLKKKNGSYLAGKDEPEWFIIENSFLSDTNGGINAVCSGPI